MTGAAQLADILGLVERERAAVNRAIADVLEYQLARVAPALREPVRYAVEAGGKRLRPILCVAAYRAATGDDAAAENALYELACGVELIHTYSLVHDDLPCMDDDDLRRGRPTAHRVFGAGIAILAGAALIPLACGAVSASARKLRLPDARGARLVRILCRASGSEGMVGGQLLDLEAEGRQLAVAELERVHRMKTGALLAASVCIGAAAGGADEVELRAFEAYGHGIGLAFQIVDDCLDVTAASDVLGKTAGKDVAVAKSTYPALLGLERARARAEAEITAALAALEGVGRLTPALDALGRYAIEREN